MENVLTVDALQKSKEFNDWIGDDKVELIHCPYEEGYPAYIVIHHGGEGYFITRFWKSPNNKMQLNKIHVSVDHKGLTATQVFKVLLSDYSKSLD